MVDWLNCSLLCHLSWGLLKSQTFDSLFDRMSDTAMTDRSPCLRWKLQVSFTSTMNIVINYANVWHGDIVWCQVIELKAGLLTERLRYIYSSVGCNDLTHDQNLILTLLSKLSVIFFVNVIFHKWIPVNAVYVIYVLVSKYFKVVTT